MAILKVAAAGVPVNKIWRKHAISAATFEGRGSGLGPGLTDRVAKAIFAIVNLTATSRFREFPQHRNDWGV